MEENPSIKFPGNLYFKKKKSNMLKLENYSFFNDSHEKYIKKQIIVTIQDETLTNLKNHRTVVYFSVFLIPIRYGIV